MAAHNPSLETEAAQPIKETQHTNLTIHSSWDEIHSELEQILRQLQELKEVETDAARRIHKN